jgi:hypothetical protein
MNTLSPSLGLQAQTILSPGTKTKVYFETAAAAKAALFREEK